MSYPYGFATPCTEMAGSPQEAVTLDSFRATVRLRCAWTNRIALANEAALFHRYPRMLYARCKSITVAPMPENGPNGVDSIGLTYESAIVQLEYVFDKDTPDESGSDLFSESIDPTAENLTLDPANFWWKSGGEALKDNEAPARLLKGLDYVLTLYNRPSIPTAAFALVGFVNDAPFATRTLGKVWLLGTLLFNPPNCQRKVTMGPTPSLTWTTTYRFAYKPDGWNKFWNPRKAGGAGNDNLRCWRGGAIVDYDQYEAGDFDALWG